MKRPAAFAATVVMVAVSLAGCGGSTYCDAVEGDRDALNAFGKTRTNEAYADYVTTFGSIAKVAPESVSDDWKMLADVTQEVITTQDEAGVALEDMTDTDKVAELSQAQLAELNEVYEKFNGTADQREAVVENVRTECDIELS